MEIAVPFSGNYMSRCRALQNYLFQIDGPAAP